MILFHQLSEGTSPLTIVTAKPELVKNGTPVPVEYVQSFATLISGRELDFVPIEDVLGNIAESPDTDLSELAVIGQTDEKITRLSDVEALVRARQASYLMPPPDMLSFAFNGPRGQSGARFAACDVDHKAVGCLEMRDNPLDTVAYDLISVGFLHPKQLPSQFAWLKWYRRGNQSPLGSAVKEIEAGQATFLLRRRLDWLTAREVTRITTGLVDEDGIPFLGAISIRTQPAVRRRPPAESGVFPMQPLKPAVDLHKLKQTGAIPNDN